jgi:hypothetical protein
MVSAISRWENGHRAPDVYYRGALIGSANEVGSLGTRGSQMLRWGDTEKVKKAGSRYMRGLRRNPRLTQLGRWGRSSRGVAIGRASVGVGVLVSLYGNSVVEGHSLAAAALETSAEVGGALAGAKVGAVAGALIGGPVGALIGAAIGGVVGGTLGARGGEYFGRRIDGY